MLKNIKANITLLLAIFISFTLAMVLPILVVDAAEDGEYRYDDLLNYRVTNNEAEIISVNSTIGGELILPSTINGCKVTSISGYAFWGSSFESITLPDTIISIGDNAFEGADSKRIILPDSVTSIGNKIFSTCLYLEEVRLSENCNYVSQQAFDGCFALKNIKIPDCVTRIEANAFAYCKSLEELNLPANLEYIGDYAFVGCNKLTEVEIPQSVLNIGSFAFAYNDALKLANINSPLANVGEYCFCYNPALETIRVNSKTIGKNAFYNCSSLKNIYISKNVKAIGVAVLYGSPVENIYYSGTKKQWDEIVIETGNAELENKDDIIFVSTNTMLESGKYIIKTEGDITDCLLLFACFNDNCMEYVRVINCTSSNEYVVSMPENIVYDDIKIYVWDKQLKPIFEGESAPLS
ncbi:MAG: leucine-rich repeat domain-containing protein [Clostridia bacterium]|nr:leucine-rich repeat domain-containing protein [Clostridia bacterium]